MSLPGARIRPLSGSTTEITEIRALSATATRSHSALRGDRQEVSCFAEERPLCRHRERVQAVIWRSNIAGSAQPQEAGRVGVEPFGDLAGSRIVIGAISVATRVVGNSGAAVRHPDVEVRLSSGAEAVGGEAVFVRACVTCSASRKLPRRWAPPPGKNGVTVIVSLTPSGSGTVSGRPGPRRRVPGRVWR